MTTSVRWLSWLVAGACVAAAVATASAARSPQGVWVQLRDGARVTVPGAETVYVVDRGTLRPVTGAAHRALWPGFQGVVEIASVPEGSLGPRLDEKTCLVKDRDDPAVWLLDQRGTVRRHVVDPHVFQSKWAFSWGKVRRMPIAEIEALPVGDPVE
jgi:hypothetical protein